jgi:hypothetical protein
MVEQSEPMNLSLSYSRLIEFPQRTIRHRQTDACFDSSLFMRFTQFHTKVLGKHIAPILLIGSWILGRACSHYAVVSSPFTVYSVEKLLDMPYA